MSRKRPDPAHRAINEQYAHRNRSFWFPVRNANMHGMVPVEIAVEGEHPMLGVMPTRNAGHYASAGSIRQRAKHLSKFTPAVLIPTNYFSTLIRQKGQFRYGSAREAIADLRERIFKIVPEHRPIDFESSLKRGLSMDPLLSIKTGAGTCVEKASIIVAICRANGIPARVVGHSNFYGRRHLLFGKEQRHFWAEVFDAGQDKWVAIDTVRPSLLDHPLMGKRVGRARVFPEIVNPRVAAELTRGGGR